MKTLPIINCIKNSTSHFIFILFIGLFFLFSCSTPTPEFEAEKELSNNFMIGYQNDDYKKISDSALLVLDELIEKLHQLRPYSDQYLMQAILVKANDIALTADYNLSNNICFNLLSDVKNKHKKDTSIQLLHAEIHSLIGYNYDKMNQFEAAINHYDKAILIYESFNNHIDAATQYSNQSLAYISLGNSKKALEVIQTAKSTLDTIRKPNRKELMLQSHNRSMLANVNRMRGFRFGERNQLDSMKVALKKSNQGFLAVTNYFKNSKSIPPQIYILYANLAANHSYLGMTDKSYADSAIYYLKKIIPAYKEKNKVLIQPELLGYFQGLLASNYLQKKDFDKALITVDQALNNMDYDEYKTEAAKEGLTTQHPDKMILGINVGLKGMIYFKLYQETKKQSYLENSRALLEEATSTIDNSYLDLTPKRTVITLRSHLEGVFRTYLYTFIELVRKTDDIVYFEKALEVTEKYKNFFLRKGLSRQLLSYQTEGERKIMIETEQKLENKRRLLNQKIRKNPENKSILIDSLLILQKVHANFLNQLKNSNNPVQKSYYFNRYDQTVPNLKTIKNNFIDSNTAVIEYHFSGASPIAIIITSKEHSIIPLKVDDRFYKDLEELQESLEYQNLEILKRSAHSVYNTIFKEVDISLPENINQLIIVPDKELREIPFDLLLSSFPASELAVNEFPFLLQKYAIGYLYSLSTYYLAEQLFQSKAKNQKLDFIGFNASPSNPEQDYDFYQGCNPGPLNYLTALTTKVAQLFPDNRQQVFQNAKKQDFIKNAAKADILYLAMHGCSGGRAPLDYGLQFSDDQERLMTVNEILNLSLHARLVVLGSCETEHGQLSVGEGIASIARAFRRAGCLNMIAAQNIVNDKFGAMIYADFYKNWIEKGDNSIVALTKAKRAFLDNPNLKSGDKHPNYWAGIISIGKPIYWEK